MNTRRLALLEVAILCMATDSVGEGEDYRAESKRGDHASALAFEDTVVHGSVVAARRMAKSY